MLKANDQLLLAIALLCLFLPDMYCTTIPLHIIIHCVSYF